MTDRYCGFMVTLSNDTREDDAEAIQTALRMVQGVASVDPVVSNPGAAAMADMQIRSKLSGELLAMARGILHGDGR